VFLFLGFGGVVLFLEEVDGKCGSLARSSTHAEVLVAGLNHLERCLVVPRCTLKEQAAERLHRGIHLLFGAEPIELFHGVHGVEQLRGLVAVQKDAFSFERARWAARFFIGACEAEDAMTGSLRGKGAVVLDRIEGLGELHGGRGLHGGSCGRVFGFSVGDPSVQFFLEIKKKRGFPPPFFFFFLFE